MTTLEAMTRLVDQAYENGKRDGKREAHAIHLPESSYGATQSAIVAVPFRGLRSLIDQIYSRRDYRHGDNPGMAYMWTCELIHIHHGDYESIALLKCGAHYDI
jgi:hypothetical protein